MVRAPGALRDAQQHCQQDTPLLRSRHLVNAEERQPKNVESPEPEGREGPGVRTETPTREAFPNIRNR